MKINKTNLFSIIVGIVFIISGFSKSLDATTFAKTINLYEIANLWFLSPVIIIFEIFLGLSLLLKIQLKRISFISIIFLAGLTLTYIYGWLFKDITDCGCFGHINILNSSPIFTLVRNAILIYLCVDLYLSNGKEVIDSKTYINICFIIAICIVSFISGYTLEEVSYKYKKDKKYVAVKDLSIGSHISTSADSTYLVFAFSYSCSHCMNSIENLKQYEKSGVVDKVIALTVNNDEKSEEFKKLYEPNFEIKHIEKKDFIKISNSFPRSFFIENDTLQFTLSGELPSAYVLKDVLDKRGK